MMMMEHNHHSLNDDSEFLCKRKHANTPIINICDIFVRNHFLFGSFQFFKNILSMKNINHLK